MLNEARVRELVDEITGLVSELHEELNPSDEPWIEVPGQGVWRQSMIERLRPQISHLPGVVALLDECAEHPEEVVHYEEVMQRSGLDPMQQRNEHARLSRVARELFGRKIWPMEAWQDSMDGQMRYRMSQAVADWWRAGLRQ